MTVLIVEDHPVVVEGIQKIISANGKFSSCLTAFSGQECKRILELCTPELVLLDINLPDINGIDLCKHISNQYPTVKILAISSYNERSMILKMLESGACGYVLKNADEHEITEAINTVCSGAKYLGEEVSGILENKDNITGPMLTRRETEVLRLISEGYTNQEIADKLSVSASTVDSHRKNILLKLDTRNTAACITKAIKLNLI